MADSDITGLPELTGVVSLSDNMVIDDVSAGVSTRTKKIAVSGVNFRIIEPFLTGTGIPSLKTDVINEKTADAGVTIDGILLKDTNITTGVVNADTVSSDLVTTDTLGEETPGNGVQVNSSLELHSLLKFSKNDIEVKGLNIFINGKVAELSVTGQNNFALCTFEMLNGEKHFVTRGDSSTGVQMYKSSKGVISTVGGSFGSGALGGPALTYLYPGHIAMVSQNGGQLQTLAWTGGGFALVSSPFPVSVPIPSITSLVKGTKTVAITGPGGFGIRAYQYSGNTWAQVGTPGVFGFGGASICGVADNIVAHYNNETEELAWIRFDNPGWTRIGVAKSIPSNSGVPCLAHVGGNVIAYFDSDQGELRFYAFDGNEPQLLNPPQKISNPMASPKICALPDGNIVFADHDTDTLQELNVAFSPLTPFYGDEVLT